MEAYNRRGGEGGKGQEVGQTDRKEKRRVKGRTGERTCTVQEHWRKGKTEPGMKGGNEGKLIRKRKENEGRRMEG